ncbi:hypothetical protein BLOT_001324 [Blomia tropicalis]|nr:hypothetical protein BLOT_001324 [Blomia tropicalis]
MYSIHFYVINCRFPICVVRYRLITGLLSRVPKHIAFDLFIYVPIAPANCNLSIGVYYYYYGNIICHILTRYCLICV